MRQGRRLWLAVAAALLVASCAPPPVDSASATILVRTRDDGEKLGRAFRTFARKHGMVVAEADIGGGPLRPVRRRDALGLRAQIYSSNPISPDETIVHFYRGGATYRIAPAREGEVLKLAQEFCRTISDEPSVIWVRAARGALMADEVPPEAGCALAKP